MEAALTLLDLTEPLTAESIKRAFKRTALRAHPDKGGSQGAFDDALAAYLLISTHLRRQTGGRNGLTHVDPLEVEQARQQQFERELNNLVMEVFDAVEGGVGEAFHEAFERFHVSDRAVDTRDRYQEMMEDPYASQWYQGHAIPVEPSTATIDHRAFEAAIPPAPVTALLLQEMATYSRPTGTLLLPDEVESLDGQYAPLFIGHAVLPAVSVAERSLEDLMAARQEIAPETDVEMEERVAYERRCAEREMEHQTRITEYFAAAPSSQWALREKGDADSFIKTV